MEMLQVWRSSLPALTIFGMLPGRGEYWSSQRCWSRADARRSLPLARARRRRPRRGVIRWACRAHGRAND